MNQSKDIFLSKHFLFSKTSSRRLQDVFSVTLFVFQDLLKTSSRHLQDVFAIRLPKTSSRRFQDAFKTSSKTSSRRVCKTSCNYVFKTSWKTKKCYTEDVFSTSSPRRLFPRLEPCLIYMMVCFCENSWQLSAVSYFRK